MAITCDTFICMIIIITMIRKKWKYFIKKFQKETKRMRWTDIEIEKKTNLSRAIHSVWRFCALIHTTKPYTIYLLSTYNGNLSVFFIIIIIITIKFLLCHIRISTFWFTFTKTPFICTYIIKYIVCFNDKNNDHFSCIFKSVNKIFLRSNRLIIYYTLK